MARTRLLQRWALVQALAIVTTALVRAARSGSNPAARSSTRDVFQNVLESCIGGPPRPDHGVTMGERSALFLGADSAQSDQEVNPACRRSSPARHHRG